ncbi:MAG TPA: TolC family outer membrane protein [Ensifer sp.]|jgi:outer membrane protein|uniref:TolC family outer membrane protein n=1 Tax=Ensifer sp. TaxID=1872086 RepID=UPI002E1583CD|nr:TolC family outer membrane protein [Ensifer sp.]
MIRLTAAFALLLAALTVDVASAEPLSSALAKAYRNNPTLNAARAGVRMSAYDVDIASSAMRPKIKLRSGMGYSSEGGGGRGTFGIVLDQTLFDGLQTTNNVAVHEARLRAAEENTRNTEQNVLFEATEAYMDVVLGRRMVVLRKQDLEFLSELARSERARRNAGERTRTDVAQAEARRAAAQAELDLAHAEVKRAQATYRQVIGDEPGKLSGAKPPSGMLPATLDKALATAETQHPALLAKRHLAEGAVFGVAATEGKLLPGVTGSIGIGRGQSGSATDTMAFEPGATSRKVGIEVKVPVYQGGKVSGQVRQSKEQLGKSRFEVDTQSAEVQAKAAGAWAQYQAATASVSANRVSVDAAKVAMAGIVAEREIGQRTLLEVLKAQADVVRAQVKLADAERNMVVGGYRILSAIGRLGAKDLGLVTARKR